MQIQRIKDVTKFYNGYAFKSKNYTDAGEYIVRIGDIKQRGIDLSNAKRVNILIEKKDLSNYQIKQNSILLAMSGATTGKVSLYNLNQKAYLNQRVGMLVCENNILPKYLYYFLSNYSEKFLSSAIGAAVQNLSKSQIENTEIPVPSLQEQEKIVERLDKVFENISKFFKVMKTKQKLFKTLKLAGELNIVDSFQSKEYKLDEICTLITDGTHHTPTYIRKGIPFLSVKNITNGKVDFNNTKYVSKNEHNKLVKRCNPEVGDILYSKVGTTGVAQMINTHKEFSIFVSLALLKVDKSIVMPELLQYLLNTSYVYKQAQDRTKGVANRNLVLREIKEIRVKFPKKEQEQRKLLKKLREFNIQLSNLEANNELRADQLSLLSNSILSKEFSYE